MKELQIRYFKLIRINLTLYTLMERMIINQFLKIPLIPLNA